MPDECEFPIWFFLHKHLQLYDDSFCKIHIEQTWLLFGIIAQIAVFATEVAGVGWFKNYNHYLLSLEFEEQYLHFLL